MTETTDREVPVIISRDRRT